MKILDELIGKSKEEVIAKLDTSNLNYRVIREDGVRYPHTMEMRPTRANLEFDDNKFTKYKFG